MTTASELLAAAVPKWCSQLRGNDLISARVVDRLVDVIGISFAAADLPNVLAAQRVECFGEGTCSVWNRQTKSSAFGAAFANGMASHSLEYDDYSEVAAAHPSVIV